MVLPLSLEHKHLKSMCPQIESNNLKSCALKQNNRPPPLPPLPPAPSLPPPPPAPPAPARPGLQAWAPVGAGGARRAGRRDTRGVRGPTNDGTRSRRVFFWLFFGERVDLVVLVWLLFGCFGCFALFWRFLELTDRFVFVFFLPGKPIYVQPKGHVGSRENSDWEVARKLRSLTQVSSRSSRFLSSALLYPFFGGGFPY